MVMAKPLANKAGKFATLAEVTLPPVLFVVAVLEVKSNSHCANVSGFSGHNRGQEALTSVFSFSTLRRASRVGAFCSPSKSSAVLVALGLVVLGLVELMLVELVPLGLVLVELVL